MWYILPNSGKRRTATLVLLLAFLTMPVSAAVYFSTSAPGIITKGDPLSVSGTGAVNGTVGIWIVGRDHFEVLTTAPDRHGNFSITLKPSATGLFSSGQYAIVYQDPGANGVLEIEGGTDVNRNLAVMNRGKIVARLGHRQELAENIRMVVDQILNTTSIPGVDDTFQAEYFFVEEPAIHFDKLIPASGFRHPDQIAGERMVITGTTNLGTENTISTEIRTRNTRERIMVKNVPVSAGYPINTWIWDLEAPGLPPGDYELTAAWPKSNTTATASFTVIQPVPPTNVAGGIFRPEIPPAPPGNDYTFPVFIAATLIVLAIVLYFAGRE
jgi:hypothetical protein